MLRSLKNLVLALMLPSACGALSPDSVTDGTSETPPSAHGDLHGGQTGSETGLAPGCGENTVTALDMDEVSEAGFSARELLEHLVGSYEQDWTWSDGTVTAATLMLEARSGQARWYDADAEDAATELATTCDSQLEAPATLTLKTADGQLNERWSVRLLSRVVNDVSVQPAEPISMLAGAFEPAAIEQHLALKVDSYFAHFRVFDGAASGSLAAIAQSTGGTSPDSLTESQTVPLGEFGTPPDDEPAME